MDTMTSDNPSPATTSTASQHAFDRCYFQSADADGSSLFACAMGNYAGLGVTDASFSVVLDGIQHNIRASRARFDDDRIGRPLTTVGPISIEVLDPARRVRIVVAETDGVSADLTFEALGPELEEPPFRRDRVGEIGSAEAPAIDYLRWTQHGAWSGTVTIAGRVWQVSPESNLGVRDRSRGIRPLPGALQRRVGEPAGRQMSWLWIPLVFGERLLLVDVQGDHVDAAFHRSGRVIDRRTGAVEEVEARTEISFSSGDPHVSQARIWFTSELDGDVEVLVTPHKRWSMSGVGYQHPAWGFGIDHGALEVGTDAYDLSAIDWSAPLHRHVQAVSSAEWASAQHRDQGSGIVEQLFAPKPLPAPGILAIRTTS